MIREGKTYQIDNVIRGGTAQGMTTMDGDIARLLNEGRITRDVALGYALSAANVEKNAK